MQQVLSISVICVNLLINRQRDNTNQNQQVKFFELTEVTVHV